MSDDPVKLSLDEALSVLAEGERVHCFSNPGGMLIGADWKRERVAELFASTERLEVSGDLARKMKHGVVAFDGARPLFFATDAARLDALEAARASAEVQP